MGLQNMESGTAVSLLRACNVLCGGLALGVAGCWHVYHIITCSDEADADGLLSTDCMSFFPALSSAIVALYIMCGRLAHAGALPLRPRRRPRPQL